MIKDTIEAVRRLVATRSFAYKFVLKKDERYVKLILLDLAKFCRAHESTFHADPRMHAVLEGRKEVWLRIQNFLNLSEQELFDLHSVKYLPKENK